MGDAFANVFATFVHKPAFGLLATVDGSFAKITDNLINSAEFVPAFLLVRSHATFRGACRMAASGQVSEAHPLLRACLEYSLYALHIHLNPGHDELWLKRHEDAEALKKCRRAFQHIQVSQTLKGKDAALHKTIDALYEQTIDFGAHPNERAVTNSLRIEQRADRTTFQNMYLHGDGAALDQTLRATAQVGLGSLLVFEWIFGARFRLLGIDLELRKLRQMI